MTYALTKITDHTAEGIALFIERYQDKPLIAAWAKSYLDSCQEIEGVFWDILMARAIDSAVGWDLDVLGRIVGQPRIGETDDIYRLFIRVKILVNRSRSYPDDVIAVVQAALNGLRFKYVEYYPASFVVDVLDPLPANADLIAMLIRKAKASGVGMNLHYSPDHDTTDEFTFSDTDVEQADVARGWDDGSGTLGGVWISAI